MLAICLVLFPIPRVGGGGRFSRFQYITDMNSAHIHVKILSDLRGDVFGKQVGFSVFGNI